MAYQGMKILDECDDEQGKDSTPKVMKAREQATYRRWLAGRLAPKEYGDSAHLKHSGDKEAPLAMTWAELGNKARGE